MIESENEKDCITEGAYLEKSYVRWDTVEALAFIFFWGGGQNYTKCIRSKKTLLKNICNIPLW